MDRSEIWKYISVFLSSTLFFSKIGMPTAVTLFKFHYFKVIITSCAGAIFSTVVFTYLSDVILKWWDKLKDRFFTKKGPKKKFTKTNRLVIKIKRRFGLAGIAALAPFIISIPLGAFLGERFYKDKRKVIIYISVSTILWSNILYVVYYLLYHSVKSIAS